MPMNDLRGTLLQDPSSGPVGIEIDSNFRSITVPGVPLQSRSLERTSAGCTQRHIHTPNSRNPR